MRPSTPARDLLDREFLEIRAKIVELAASLDRLDRADGSLAGDPRLPRLRRAIQIVAEREGDRAERVLLSFSLPYDPDWAAAMGLPPPGAP